MKSVAFSILAAGCAAVSSLCFRVNTSKVEGKKNSPTGYLIVFYLFSFCLSFVIDKTIWDTDINYVILAIGVVVGILSSMLMRLTSRALEHGPSGLTFAFLNASAIFPGLILYLLLGCEYGFVCTKQQIFGMFLVMVGLFLGGWQETQLNSRPTSSKWIKYVLACFVVQIFALTCIQARCLLFNGHEMQNLFSTFRFTDADDLWFMPGQFGASLVMQGVLYFSYNEKLQFQESLFGGLGGLANFSSTALLLFSTKIALPVEKGILFPCFAVFTMILCNIWANKLYKEKCNLLSVFICSLGIFLAVS